MVNESDAVIYRIQNLCKQIYWNIYGWVYYYNFLNNFGQFSQLPFKIWVSQNKSVSNNFYFWIDLFYNPLRPVDINGIEITSHNHLLNFLNLIYAFISTSSLFLYSLAVHLLVASYFASFRFPQ